MPGNLLQTNPDYTIYCKGTFGALTCTECKVKVEQGWRKKEVIVLRRNQKEGKTKCRVFQSKENPIPLRNLEGQYGEEKVCYNNVTLEICLHWGLFCTGHAVLQVELSLFTALVIFSTCVLTIACTLSMLSRLRPSRRPCRTEIWLLALRRLIDILFSFTCVSEAERGELAKTPVTFWQQRCFTRQLGF